MKEEAFVYLWQDARQKSVRYYLGYHKGNPDDSYTHSSTVFESFSKDSIPAGVRRRVIAVGSAEEMMELENKLLNNRKGSRKWDRYYNVITHFPPYMWDDPEHREMNSLKMSKQSKKQWEDPEHRAMMSEKMSDTMKKRWEDPAYREMKSKKMSDTMKKQWEDPAYREKMAEKWEDPEHREMMSEKMSKRSKKQWEDPDFREMQSERSKKLWEDPVKREMQSEKMTKQATKQWEDPAYREMQSEKHTCTVCGFVAYKRHIVQWHNDNCKHKK